MGGGVRPFELKTARECFSRAVKCFYLNASHWFFGGVVTRDFVVPRAAVQLCKGLTKFCCNQGAESRQLSQSNFFREWEYAVKQKPVDGFILF